MESFVNKINVKILRFSEKKNNAKKSADFKEEKNEIEIKIFQDYIKDKYSSIIWPGAHLLCQFIIDNAFLFCSKTVVELGSGTGICGIMACKVGANVILTEKHDHSGSKLKLIKKNIDLNHVEPKSATLTWGEVSNLIDILPVNQIIGSDLFFDESEFENLILVVSLMMADSENPSSTSFYLTHHLRCSNHNIYCLLKKYNLKGRLILSNQEFNLYLYEIQWSQ